MATIVLQISYNFKAKKFTVSKSWTASQLAQHAMEKFALEGMGYLTSNGKPLDSSLPLRLTSLTNNSKLKLEVQSGSIENILISIKLLVSVNDKASTFLLKVPASTSLLATLQLFEEENGVSLINDSVQLIILHQTYSDLSLTLASIVGPTDNIVIRVNYSQAEAKIQSQSEQEKINQLHLQQQHERNEKLKLQREEAATERSQRIKQDQLHSKTLLQQPQPHHQTADGLSQTHRENRNEELENHLSQQLELELQSEPPEPAPTPNQPANYTYSAPELQESPQLFTPTNASIAYENPEDDYNMTVNQAKTYQKVIQNSAKKVSKKTVRAPPSKLFIRIKFPDRNILQINFINDLPNTKVGQLIKKIDELLLPEFINNYNLKIGYPPFSKLELSFDNNNKKLIELPDFMQEKVVLIWETAVQSNGPFLKQNAISDIKSSAELPELILEKHRGELPSEAKSSPSNSGINPTYKSSESQETKPSKQLPKWFKTK